MNIPEWAWWVWNNCKVELGILMVSAAMAGFASLTLYGASEGKSNIREFTVVFFGLLILLFMLFEGMHLAI